MDAYVENEGELFETKEDNDAIFSIDHNKENDLIELITNAQNQGLNCLDLSKKNIKDFPSQLLELTSLQYLYLEGNKLTQLSPDLFLRLPHIKWLDLRNNQLTSIPSLGLANHRSLQYLLLSQNRLQALPFELGKVKTLSALNLDGNPLNHPPFSIIKQGIKAIQQYLRDKLTSDQDSSGPSDDDPEGQSPRFPYEHNLPRKTKYFDKKNQENSEVGYYEATQLNPLPPHLQSCIQYKRMNCLATRPSSSTRSRPQSEIRFPQVKSKINMKPSNNHDTDVCTMRELSLMHLKQQDIKIDDELKHLRQQSFITTFEEPNVQTPFLMDSHYTEMTNKERPKTSTNERRRNYSIQNDEERRKHDRQIQDRIRQITDRMLRRRLEARSSLFEEKRQVRLELREIRRLESDAVKQHRSDHLLKSQKKNS